MATSSGRIRKSCFVTRFTWTAALLVLTTTYVVADPMVVNCDQGQSINRMLSRLEKHTPATVLVKGTCSEYVQVNGFEGLTLKALPGATLQQPSKDPTNGLVIHVLQIVASRGVTVDGFTIHSGPSALADVGIGKNSIDVELRNLTVDGPSVFGIFVYESSQVSLARVTARDPNYATVGVADLSDVHIESSLFENTTGAIWHVGLEVDSGHVTIQSTTIRDMTIGININAHGSVDIQSFNSYFPVVQPNDVLIENPAATNFYGVSVGNSSMLNLGDTKLRITTPGQPWGANTGGVSVNGGTLNAGANLIVSGSQGQGIFLSGNSHASLAGSSITASGHGGLVLTNLSTASVATGNSPLTQISGNGTDVFCDSKSVISGGADIANAATVQCGNLLPGDYEPIP